MIDAKLRRDSRRRESLIGVYEIAEICAGENHVMQAGMTVGMRFDARHADYHDAMMLTVIGNKSELRVVVHGLTLRHPRHGPAQLAKVPFGCMVLFARRRLHFYTNRKLSVVAGPRFEPSRDRERNGPKKRT